jgi:hypothetical protein
MKSRAMIDSKISNLDMKVPEFIMTAPPFDSQNDDQDEECTYFMI